MILRDRLDVSAGTAPVWDVLDDPALMELWNPKCVRCAVECRHVHVGLRYRASFRLSGPERQSDCEILACIPGERLTTRFATEPPGRTGYVDETFRLQPVAQGTRVVHEADFIHSPLPRWLGVFMKVMDMVGRQAGRSSLDGIKELLETSKS
jgi:uncharacterized protein YndB with AHSA1/START domain